MSESKVTGWLRTTNPTIFTAYVIIAAFSTYFCMYAFRKPLAATGYDDMMIPETLWHYLNMLGFMK